MSSKTYRVTADDTIYTVANKLYGNTSYVLKLIKDNSSIIVNVDQPLSAGMLLVYDDGVEADGDFDSGAPVVSVASLGGATIVDQDGNVVAEVAPNGTYAVIVASGIDEGGSSIIYSDTIIDG